MTDYEWLTAMNLCHRCRKNRPAPNRKFCFDCLDKIREDNAKRYDSEKAKMYQKRRREIYLEKKEKGICVRCSKKATNGIYCLEHYIVEHRKAGNRAAEEKRRRHDRGLIPKERMGNNKCLWCGKNSIPGTNVCEEHQKIFSEAGKKSRKTSRVVDDFWKMKRLKKT